MNYGNRAPRAEYNVVCFIEDMNSVGDEINIDLTALYNDASMIFENNPTHEGATEAAELYLAVATEVSEQFTAEVRALISKHRLNRSQCIRLGIEGFLARVDQASKKWLNKFRLEFVENAPDGATERLDRMSEVFSNMFEDIFCSNKPT